jgi:hypothetical protein
MTSRNNLPHIQAKQFLSGGIEAYDYTSQLDTRYIRILVHEMLSDRDFRFSGHDIQELFKIFFRKERQPPYMDLIRERICKDVLTQLRKSAEKYTTMDQDLLFENSIYESFMILERISKSQLIQEQLPILKNQFQELSKSKMPITLE